MTTAVQFSACATATAVRCLPMPDGPANSRLGGRLLPPIERDSRSISRTWPTTSLKGIVGCYHALAALFLRRRRLGRGRRIIAAVENPRPEPAPRLRRLRRHVGGGRGGARSARGARGRGRRRDAGVLDVRRRRPVIGAE